MLIAIDGNEANIPQRVGVNQFAFELLRRLARLATAQNRIVVFLKDRPLPDLPTANEYFTYEVFGPKKAWVLTGLSLRLLRSPHPDVLFSPSHYVPLLSATKRVFSIMDLSYEKFGADYFRQYDLQQLRRWTRLSVAVASKIITISNSAKSDIESIYKVPASKVEVIYPGYDDQTYHSRIPLTKQQQVRHKYGITGKFFLFVGTLQPRKNILNLIRAFAKLGGGTKLVIVGKKGWLYDDILTLAQKLGVDKKVIFPGFVHNDDLPALYKASVAYVLPSLYEGFGLPVIEAQACGAITLVSAVSSLPEVAGKGSLYIKNPYKLHSIAEGLRSALSLSRTKRDALITINKENVKRFSWDQAAQNLLGLLLNTKKG